MILCFPVESYQGHDSKVFGHFGSAPGFVLIDTETGEARELVNKDANHTHGKCSPLKALDGQSIDCVIVGGIGAGALNKLTSQGLSVYMAGAASVTENVSLFNEGRLKQFNPMLVCGGHGKGGGCAHH